MKNDIENLRLLVIAHYVLAAIMALFACLPLIHIAIGLFVLFGSPAQENPTDFPNELFATLFIVVGAISMIVGWALAFCLYQSGRFIDTRRNYTFCFVVAVVACVMFTPLGTILGIFTIIVLSRPAVKAMFESTTASVSHDDTADTDAPFAESAD